MNGYGQCPRCDAWAVEHLRTHSFCWDCNYSPEVDAEFAAWHELEFRNSRIAEQRRYEDERALFRGSDSVGSEDSGGNS